MGYSDFAGGVGGVPVVPGNFYRDRFPQVQSPVAGRILVKVIENRGNGRVRQAPVAVFGPALSLSRGPFGHGGSSPLRHQ